MTIRVYHHILHRVEYPMERGYRMEPSQLPDWMHISINESANEKHLTVHSRIHINKEDKVGPTYSHEVSDKEMIRDLSPDIYNRFIR